MIGTGRGKGAQLKSRPGVKAGAIGVAAFLVTSFAVSRATPDGNLVVTLVPALAVGIAAFSLALRLFRRGRSG